MAVGLVQAWLELADAAGTAEMGPVKACGGAGIGSLCGAAVDIGEPLGVSSFGCPEGNAITQIATTALTMPAIQEAFSSGKRSIVRVTSWVVRPNVM
jgi:hypothetical protein